VLKAFSLFIVQVFHGFEPWSWEDSKVDKKYLSSIWR